MSLKLPCTGCLSPVFRINDTLKEFLESGVATLIGTADSTGRPHVAYGWAPRVKDETTMEVFIDAARAERTLRNLDENGRIAVTVAHPVSVRSVQLKGTFIEAGAPEGADNEYVRERREDFVTSTSLIGDPPDIIRALWLEDVLRLAFSVELAFDQTPGPNAGQPL
jgi:hypothetical protein